MTEHFFLSSFTWFLLSFFLIVPFFEWTLHSQVMHAKPFGIFRYAHRAHEIVHHGTFRANSTYHLQDVADKATIPMAWWNAPVLILIGEIPFVLLSWFYGWENGIWAGSLLAYSLYYVAYEYMHWCMHLPKAKRRLIERWWIFKKLNGHHLLHHFRMRKNYNVVVPIADLCLGTLLLRAPVIFKQPTGESVPNVQPIDQVTAPTDQIRCAKKNIWWTERLVTWLMDHHPVPWLMEKIKKVLNFA